VGKNNLLVTVWTPRNSPTVRLEEIPIAALKRNALNPRVHPEKQIRMLAESIAAFGFLIPCLVDQHNRLINGHARVLAAERRGMTSVPCIRIEHLNEVDKRAFVVADAKLSELGHWDPEILRSQLRFLSELRVHFNFSAIGFETAEVDRILDGPVIEPGDEPSADTHARRPAISRRGDLWQAGRHVVVCADPVVTQSYEPLERARLVIADLPQWLFRGSDADHDGRGDGDRAGSDATTARIATLPAVNLPAESLPTECLLRNFATASLDGSLHYIGTGGRHLGEMLRAGKAVYSEWLDLELARPCRRPTLPLRPRTRAGLQERRRPPRRQHQGRRRRPQPIEPLGLSSHQRRPPGP
jgi:ParB-like nuclease family protein